MIHIRQETSEDYRRTYQLHTEAFDGEEEAKLVERIRSTDKFIPELSLVAEGHGEIVGHLLLSKAELIDPELQRSWEVIVLAPLSVSPSRQKQGIGSKLMESGLEKCRELGYSGVFLIGHPGYYPKFGFKPARAHGFELTQYEVQDDVFMVCELEKDALDGMNGELVYPESFQGV